MKTRTYDFLALKGLIHDSRIYSFDTDLVFIFLAMNTIS